MINNMIEVSNYEAEALSIISEILAGHGTFRIERRSENYLTLFAGRYGDFCRLKTTERVTWITLDMCVCSESVRNHKQFDDISNKNIRHWKISLLNNDDIRNYSDFIIASFEGSIASEMVLESAKNDAEIPPNDLSTCNELSYVIKVSDSNRSSKGKSLFTFIDDYVAIDLETTGLSPKYDEIIEFAGIRVRNGVVVDTMQTFVKPSCEIDEFITNLTGITNDMVSDAPTPKDILPAIRDFIGSDIVVGHNVCFDVNFLYDNFKLYFDERFKNDYIDTMRISRKLLPDLKHHRLKDIVTKLEIPQNTYHRAMNDCKLTFECFEIMKTKFAESAELLLHSSKNFDAKTIVADTDVFDETHPMYGKRFVFTGVLEKFARTQAAQIVVNLGGICENAVTKETNYLVLGNNDYCKSIKDGKSSKHKKAESYKLKGCDIEIIPEQVFYDMIES